MQTTALLLTTCVAALCLSFHAYKFSGHNGVHHIRSLSRLSAQSVLALPVAFYFCDNNGDHFYWASFVPGPVLGALLFLTILSMAQVLDYAQFIEKSGHVARGSQICVEAPGSPALGLPRVPVLLGIGRC